MVEYICNTCKKVYKHKSDYTKHLNKKIPCKENPPNIRQNPPNIRQNPPKKEEKRIMCMYCDKTFTRSDSLNKHVKDRCKVKKQQNENNEKILNGLINEMNEMKQKIGELEKENKNLQLTINNNKQNVNNIKNQQNIQINNNNNNIKILSFGKEDISHITDDVYKRILKKGMGSVPSLIEYIHFNKNKPENHNVYISNIRSNYAMIYEELNWKLKDQKDVLERLFDKIDILEEKFEELLKDLSEPTIELLNEIFASRTETPINNEIKKRIKLLLYNKKELPEKTREIINSNNCSSKQIDNEKIIE
jgi:uncharacterized C2H2 Zn-finger protein